MAHRQKGGYIGFCRTEPEESGQLVRIDVGFQRAYGQQDAGLVQLPGLWWSLTVTIERNDLGIQAVLKETRTPKGSFYHHFASKEDFALQVVDRYMDEVHRGLDACLGDHSLPPLDRVRRFFEASRDKYREYGYLGCMLGGLGQELSGISPVFQEKIETCFSVIAGRIAACMAEAQASGDLASNVDPRHLANLIVNCWEGAALRSRLRREPAPLDSMLDFYFSALAAAPVTVARV